MPLIATIPPSRAAGETAEAYRALRQVSGSGLVAKVVQVFSLRPASMRRMIRSSVEAALPRSTDDTTGFATR
jgi:hypothetical protein